MEAVNITIQEERGWSYNHGRKFAIIVRTTPEFLNEPESMITKEQKAEMIAQKVKEAVLNELLNKK